MDALLERLLATPALQGAAVAASAMISEDAAAVASGTLVAARQIPFATAFVGLALGIALGDLLFFAIGRFAGSRFVRPGSRAASRVERAASVFRRFGPLVIVGARCLPGSRLPTYVAAGALGTRWTTFLATAVPAAVAWSFLLLLGLSSLVGNLRPFLASVPWFLPLAVLLLGANLLVIRRLRRRAATVG